jgi:hypothetical protein
MTPYSLVGTRRRYGGTWLLRVSDMKEEGPYETIVQYQYTKLHGVNSRL